MYDYIDQCIIKPCFIDRPGFCILECENIAGGIYNITPCTFYPGKEGPFFLTISSAAPIKVAIIKK